MFARWGAFVHRHRRPIVLVTVALALSSLLLAVRVGSALSSGGWVDRTSDSGEVTDLLATRFDAGRSGLIVLFEGGQDADARAETFQEAVGQTLSGLRDDSRVESIIGYAETRDARFISRDGDSAFVLVRLRLTEDESAEQLESLEARIQPAPGLTVRLTGYGPLTRDSNEQSEADLQRAETVSLPLALLILILVFGSLLAAGLPLLVAGLAIPSTLGLVFLVAQGLEMSIYVTNVATMLGLALAIDYSLFMVSRFREELARGRTVADAVERTMATSGKAVAFSGFAVAIGLSGLLLFEAPALSSIGVGGALVVACSVFYALTFLPAVLGMLGHRVNALSLGALGRRLGIRGPRFAATGDAWGRVARGVMRRPVLVLLPTLALLLLAGSPFLRLKQAVPDATILPPGMESRDAYAALLSDFPPGEVTPVTIVARVPGEPTSAENIRTLVDYARRLEALDTVDRVDSPFTNVRDPRTQQVIPQAQLEQLWTAPGPALPPELRAFREALATAWIRGDLVRMDAISPLDASRPEATEAIPAIRAVEPGGGVEARVGGVAAAGRDFLDSMSARLPWAVGMTLLASAVVLFLLFGSIVISVKAVLMTLLSITASFGALVWIFQEGNLSGLLGFETLGYTVAGNPIIMFSTLFGLSMDYEVLLLSRVQEAYRRTGDNTEAVAEGLARTAGVITGAALIMVTVFAAFALAEVITIKSIGVGMAIAVFLDATIIRVLLVPATMRLMGRWNWWAPGPLGRFAERLGFGHQEDEQPPPEGARQGVRAARA